MDFGFRPGLVAELLLLAAALGLFAMLVRSRIRNKRIQRARTAFAAKIPVVRLGLGSNRLLCEIATLEAAQRSMTAAKEKIFELAPVIPPLDNEYEGAAQLRSRMSLAINQDLEGIALGSVEVTLSAILQDVGYPIPELIVDAISGIRDQLTEHPEHFVETLKPLLLAALEPTADHTIDAIGLLKFAFHTEPLTEMNTLEGSDLGAEPLEDLGDTTTDAPAEGASDAAIPDIFGVIPIFTLFRSMAREGNRAINGKISTTRAVEHVTTDVITTGFFGLLGTLFIPIPFVGAGAGAWFGRTLGNIIKGRRFRKAKDIYTESYLAVQNCESSSIRQVYGAYREKVMEVSALFKGACGDVILPTEAPEISYFATKLRVTLSLEKEELSQRLEEAKNSVVDEISEGWIASLLGWSIREEAASWLARDQQSAFEAITSKYPALPEDNGNPLAFFENVATWPCLMNGPLDRCLMDSSAQISDGVKTQLKAFVRWSAIAVALRTTSVVAVLGTVKSEYNRHFELMRPMIANMSASAENVRREREALGN